MKASILTPNGLVFEGDVEGLKMPGVKGSFEVLKDHDRLVSLLETGKMVIKTREKIHSYAVTGGFAEINDNVITVMAEEALRSDEIDLKAEEEKKQQLEKKIKKLLLDSPEREQAEREHYLVMNRIAVARS